MKTKKDKKEEDEREEKTVRWSQEKGRRERGEREVSQLTQSQVSMRVKRPQAGTAAEFHFLFLLLQCEFLTILGAILRDGY